MSKWTRSDEDFWRAMVIGYWHPEIDGPLEALAITSNADPATLDAKD